MNIYLLVANAKMSEQEWYDLNFFRSIEYFWCRVLVHIKTFVVINRPDKKCIN